VPHAILSPDAVERALSLRDLTDPSQGPHAMQLLVDAAAGVLTRAWGCPAIVERAHPLVTVADNYDRLLYPPGGATRDARYTRYVTRDTLLRTQTSAMIPPLLKRLAQPGWSVNRPGQEPPDDVLLVCPGLVWRRDRIDRLHVGEPHQLDLWRIRRGPPLAGAELDTMIRLVIGALAPGRAIRLEPTVHPYTAGGLEVHVEAGGEWVEVAECGVAHPLLLREAGLPEDASGLAMGLGLDRLLMLAKGIDDIRLIRSEDPRVASQMLDLAPYRPVSRHPAVKRDLSVAVGEWRGVEELGDRVREALGARAGDVESVEVLSETWSRALPAPARERLGMRGDQKNVVVRITLRAVGRTLTDAEANRLRDEVYAAIHEGARAEWACGVPPHHRACGG
jgi:phenylalanyl-tRNA synthetase alpha chain